MPTAILWVLLCAAGAAFAVQVAKRARLVAGGTGEFPTGDVGSRLRRVFLDGILQRRTITERPVAGAAHALVFWGFVAFAGYTTVEFLHGLGIVDLRGTRWFGIYRLALVPFACAVLLGITFLLVRRTIVRPPGLGTRVSIASVVIAIFIMTLMATFLLTFRLDSSTAAGQVNWWLHTLVVLAFLTLIPASKHLHLVLSPFTIFLRSQELGAVANLDFEKEQVGLETVRDLSKKNVLDALTCVECGRCQDNCPATATQKSLNPKLIVLQTQQAVLQGQGERTLASLYSEDALWQCTTCGACENQCPVGIEHLPLLIGARRGLVSNGEAPAYLAGMYSHLERRQNIWGLPYDRRDKFIESCGLEYFDGTRHDVLIWLGCAGSFDADFQKSLRSLIAILRAKQVTFGVLRKERCTGDTAKRTGNELLFQELATSNIDALSAANPKTIVTSCPHCLKTIGEDYRRFGYGSRVLHAAAFIAELTSDVPDRADDGTTVTYHDPCYLGRYAGIVDQPRTLLEKCGADVVEPERNRDNPFCCGAGGGLLFADKEEQPGSRISDVRLEQLKKTGAPTIVTACPFCSIMLKGAQTNATGDVQITDLMTYVHERLDLSDPTHADATPGHAPSLSAASSAGTTSNRSPTTP
jgi:Fe-S oxidoreductase